MVYVWDLPTRLFHWLLVGAVLVALLTGFVAPESWMGVHLAAGYLIVALLVFRLIWGVFGPEYSRISSMVRATAGCPSICAASCCCGRRIISATTRPGR